MGGGGGGPFLFALLCTSVCLSYDIFHIVSVAHSLEECTTV